MNISRSNLPFNTNIDGVDIEIGQKNNIGYPIKAEKGDYTIKGTPQTWDAVSRKVKEYVEELK